jgi:hypothetical protein
MFKPQGFSSQREHPALETNFFAFSYFYGSLIFFARLYPVTDLADHKEKTGGSGSSALLPIIIKRGTLPE